MTKPTPCPRCQLCYQCVCDAIPNCQSPVHLALLTHENELFRDTNTGRWLLEGVTPTSRHIWQRTEPCPDLIALMENPSYTPYLLFPSEESLDAVTATASAQSRQKQPLFIILDGTWQEARKMLRKSEWLQQLPAVHIRAEKASNYQLRRNQDEGNLCTLEVGSELLRALGKPQEAQALTDFFAQYVPIFKADKSGHVHSSLS